MSASPVLQLAEEALVALNAAITNVRLYPPSSSIVSQSIQRLHHGLEAVLAVEAPLVLAESEKAPLICGTPLKPPIKPQTQAVFDLLRAFGFKSLSFAKGMTPEQLLVFVTAIGRKPADVDKEGGLRRLLQNQGVSAIRFNEKLYFAVAGQDNIDPKVLSEKVNRLLAESSFFDRLSDEAIGQAAQQGPQAALETLATTIPALERRLSGIPKSRQVRILQPLVASLADADPKAQSRMVAVLAEANPQTLAALLEESETIGSDGAWITQLAQAMDETALETLGAQMLRSAGLSQDPKVANRMEAVYDRLCATPKGKALEEKIKARADSETVARQNQSHAFKKALDQFMAGSNQVLADPLFAESLPATVNLLLIRDKERTAGQVLDRIEAALAGGQADEVQAASRCLAAVGDFLILDERHDTLAQRLAGTVKALKANSRIGPWAEPLIVFIHNAIQRLGALGRVADAQAAASLFQDIADGRIVADAHLVRLVCRLGECLPGQTDQGPADRPGKSGDQAAPMDPEALARHLAEADRLIRRQETEKAVSFLFDLIQAATDQKQIGAAEALRDKLFEADPMALTQIVKSGELIEAARQAAMDPEHRRRWEALYSHLSADEAGAFFFALETIACTADQVLFQQGHDNTGLYFIESGELKLVFRQGERETLVTLLKAGDVAGSESFFTTSVNTCSLQALNQAVVRRLSAARLASIKKQHAALESKLHNYCNSRPQVADLLKQKGMDRRAHARYAIDGSVQVQIVDGAGQPAGKPFRGSLADLSSGGLSFFIKTAQEEAVRRLLGRRVRLRLALTASAEPIEPAAMIVGAVYHLENDYSVHVKFDTTLAVDLTRLGLKEAGK